MESGGREPEFVRLGFGVSEGRLTQGLRLISRLRRSQANEESFFPGRVSIVASEASARIEVPYLTLGFT